MRNEGRVKEECRSSAGVVKEVRLLICGSTDGGSECIQYAPLTSYARVSKLVHDAIEMKAGACEGIFGDRHFERCAFGSLRSESSYFCQRREDATLEVHLHEMNCAWR